MTILISAAVGTFFFCAIVLCFGKKAEKHDTLKNRLDGIARDGRQIAAAANEELNRSFTERVLRPAMRRLLRLIPARISVRDRKSSSERQKKMLQQAGWTISPEEYGMLQLILMLGCGLLGLLLGFLTKAETLRVILYAFLAAFAAYTVLRYVCSATVTKRKTAMEKQLPDMLDLLSISVAAGLGFERAISYIIESMDGPLIDEFSVSYREMTLGRSRKDALSLLGDRCGVDDLSAVTGALVQAGQLGIPIGNVLQSQAAAIRRSRRSRVQEKAVKVSTKILIPMICFIFPVLLIVLLGPSVIMIIQEFS